MAQRGKVLRDTSNGKGLISANGKQFEFSLEGNWKSDVAPKVGMVVEYELTNDGQIQSISAVDQNQLAKEQADLAMKAAKEKGQALFKEASARIGTSVLVAWGALAISWLFLSAISISITANQQVGITFWSLLGIVNNSSNLASVGGGGTGDKGIYALLFVVAIVGPAISQFWKDPRAHLGSFLPLVLMVGITAMIYFSLRDAASQAQDFAGAFGGREASAMVGNMVSAMLKAVHVGVGGFVGFAAAAYLAFVGLKGYLVAKAQA